MANSDIEYPEQQSGRLSPVLKPFLSLRRGWNRLTRIIASYLPKRLYARSLLIVIMPMILLQSVVAFVFMERHWQTVTQRLSTATARDVAAIIEMIDTFPADRTQMLDIASQKLSLRASLLPPQPLPAAKPRPLFSILDNILSEELAEQVQRPFWIDTIDEPVEIRVQLGDSVLRVFAKRSQVYASNSHIFIVWMVAASLILLFIAILFLRNQVKPISVLAEAAESFGKGRPSPEFRPRGAEEVRRAGYAFIQMRERIERQMEQRTAMLTGVSHDLRTILTRFRLQLALIGSKSGSEALSADVDDMQQMLEGYLAFAKGEAQEDPGRFDISAYFQRVAEEAKLRKRQLTSSLKGDPEIHVRPNAFDRLLNNVIGNALRYAKTVHVDAKHAQGWLTVVVEDDGPGIPENMREDVFKPFLRLDTARNLDASGTGLGLSIARDIARSHGGEITLGKSGMGGLRAQIRVPA